METISIAPPPASSSKPNRLQPDHTAAQLPRKPAARITAPAPRQWNCPAAQQRHSMIERIAYAIAERRGFAPGSELQDWLTAEAEVDHWLQSERFSGD